MSEHTVIHHTFTLERTYDPPRAEVFAAWSDPAAKGRWFAGSVDHYELDFRPGGRELVRTTMSGDRKITFDARYRDIVADERLVWTATMSMNERLATVSLTTVSFAADGDGTRLELVEQGTFLDGLEQPAWREDGTASWLDRLAAELAGASTAGGR